MESIQFLWSKQQALLTPKFIFGLTALSAIMTVGSLFIVPLILCRLPADYFNNEKPNLFVRIRTASPLTSLVLIGKNISGLLLFFAGILMLFLPGQGLLTMLIGMVLMDFPGKFRLERKLIARSKVLAAINWLRARRGYPAMIVSKPI